MTELETRIQKAAQAYYTDGSSPYTDEEFDAMIEQLKKENPNSELFKTGWGYNYENDTTPGEKIKHKYGKAGSLEKCHNWDELGWALREGPVDISLKLDGLSCVLYYQNSHLIRALTRGDGEIGIDITDKVKRMFPTTVNDKDFDGAVRGEILMSFENFEKWSATHPEAKNPRNSAAGIINSKDASDEDLSYLDIIVYTIVGDENIRKTWGDRYAVSRIRGRLEKMFTGSRVVPHVSETFLEEKSFERVMNQFRDKFYSKYPADGLVITFGYLPAMDEWTDEVQYIAKAYKFPAESAKAEVTRVIWTMSKTRYAIPRIEIKPVQLSGTTVEYCTGYNAKYIKENGIGCGAVVEVSKRGEIIPNVDKVIASADPDMIVCCPICGSKLSWTGVHLQCLNNNCSNAAVQDSLIWINQLAPKDGLGDTLKQKFLEKLVSEKRIKDFTVESIMEATFTLPDDTKMSQQNDFAEMWNTLHNLQNVPAYMALMALNIPRIGGITASKLAARMDLVWEAYEAATSGSSHLPLSTSAILGGVIGMANAASIESNLDKITRLKYLVGKIQEPKKSSSVSKGKVAVTGKLSVPRAKFSEELEESGFAIGEISKDTKYLITDDPNSNSSKAEFARKHDIPMISEADFRDLYIRID